MKMWTSNSKKNNAKIIQTLKFHCKDITSCDFDENFRLVTGSKDKRTSVYEWIPGQGYKQLPFSPLSECQFAVTRVKFIQKEREILVASFDGTISIFNSENGELLHVLVHHLLMAVQDFCYIENYRALVSADSDGTVCSWDLLRRTLLKLWKISDYSINTICLSPDQILVVSGDTAGNAIIRSSSGYCCDIDDHTKERLMKDYDLHNESIDCAEFSPDWSRDGNTHEYKMITGGSDRRVKIWKVTLNRKRKDVFVTPLQEMDNHGSSITCISFNFDGSMFATTSMDHTARLWTIDKKKCKCQQVLKAHKRMILCCSFSPDGTLLVTGSYDSTAIIWDLTGERTIDSVLCEKTYLFSEPDTLTKKKDVAIIYQKIGNLGKGILSCVFSKHDFIAAGGSDKLVRLWHLSTTGTFTEISVSPLNYHQYGVTQVDFSLCGTMLASCSYDGTTAVWNLTEYNQIGSVHNSKGSVKCCKFSPDSHLLATAGDSEIVYVWNVADLQLKASLTGHADGITCLAFTKDSKYLASGCFGGFVRLWGVTPCTTICLLNESKVHDLGLTSMDFCLADKIAKDHYMLATGGNDALVKLWVITIVDELTAKAMLKLEMKGHANDVTCVRFPPTSGQILASTSIDKTARIWDLSTGSCLKVLDSKDSWLSSCAFSFDRSFLATGTFDKSITVWDLREFINEFEKSLLNRSKAKIHNTSTLECSFRMKKLTVRTRDLFALLDNDAPHEFLCPITQSIMQDPVICPDGYTYEKSALLTWLRNRCTSPMTRQDIFMYHDELLLPDFDLKKQINEYIRRRRRELRGQVSRTQ